MPRISLVTRETSRSDASLIVDTKGTKEPVYAKDAGPYSKAFSESRRRYSSSVLVWRISTAMLLFNQFHSVCQIMSKVTRKRLIRTVACRLEAPQSLVIFGLSRSSCELILNYSWHFVPVRGMARIETHWHASSRIVPTCSRRVHEQAAHSSRPGRDILS